MTTLLLAIIDLRIWLIDKKLTYMSSLDGHLPTILRKRWDLAQQANRLRNGHGAGAQQRRGQ